MEQLVVITGLAGSGKTLAADAFEDLGYFCVDNLPVELIPPFCSLIQRSGEKIPYSALVIDARERGFLQRFPEILQRLRGNQMPVQLLFFDCSDDVLKRRFSESRRPHPMTRSAATLEDAIRQEREALSPLLEVADRIIDTSTFTARQLKTFLKNAFDVTRESASPRVNVLSFGFKYGVPAEVDLLFDVRFLQNPYFIDELRPLDGRNPVIQAFLDKQPVTGEFVDRLQSFLSFLVPHYAAEGKTYLTVALGCTGGKHRSVALAERLGNYLRAQDVPATTNHRDLGRE